MEVVSGGAAVPNAWTLNAGNNTDSSSGPGPIVGPGPITAGVGYALFETGGPTSGYTPSGWVCTDPSGARVSLAGQQLTLQVGHNATCTITNTNTATAPLGPTSTPTPTRAPTLTPKPTPTPTPTATPPAPAGIAVPSSIDATGSSDASAALMSFLNTVPDGSTIVFKAGGVYRMDSALKFSGRHNLVFEGPGQP